MAKNNLTFRTLLPLLIFLSLAFALYAQTFGHAWTYDDFPVIVENADVRSWAGFWANGYPGRPLRELSFLLDHALFGMNPTGWRVQQIFWHGFNAWLLFQVALRLRAGRFAAWAGALLFLVHPLNVEVVANLSHRKDSLALAFCLLAFLAFSRACAAKKRRAGWVVLAALAWGTALLAKENAVVLPVLLLVYQCCFVPARRRILPEGRGLWPVAGFAALAWGVGWYFFAGGRARHLAGMQQLLQAKANYFGEVSWDLYYRMVLKSWTFMAGKVLWPVDLALEYTYPLPMDWSDPWVLAALFGLAVFGAGLWLTARRAPRAFFLLAWAGLFWLPVSNLWPLAYFAADRYCYAPLAGLCLLAALALGRLPLAPRVVLAVPVVFLLAQLSWRQIPVWENPQTLWTRAHRVSPTSAFALNNLGNVHLLKGELLKARDYYTEALAVNPLNTTALYNLGLIYERVGMKERALEHYRLFLKLDDPKFRAQAGALRARLQGEYGADF